MLTQPLICGGGGTMNKIYRSAVDRVLAYKLYAQRQRIHHLRRQTIGHRIIHTDRWGLALYSSPRVDLPQVLSRHLLLKDEMYSSFNEVHQSSHQRTLT